MAVGKCKTCGHEPVAQGAKYCPKCGESDPNPSNFWGIVVLVVVAMFFLNWIFQGIAGFFG